MAKLKNNSFIWITGGMLLAAIGGAYYLLKPQGLAKAGPSAPNNEPKLPGPSLGGNPPHTTNPPLPPIAGPILGGAPTPAKAPVVPVNSSPPAASTPVGAYVPGLTPPGGAYLDKDAPCSGGAFDHDFGAWQAMYNGAQGKIEEYQNAKAANPSLGAYYDSLISEQQKLAAQYAQQLSDLLFSVGVNACATLSMYSGGNVVSASCMSKAQNALGSITGIIASTPGLPAPTPGIYGDWSNIPAYADCAAKFKNMFVAGKGGTNRSNTFLGGKPVSATSDWGKML